VYPILDPCAWLPNRNDGRALYVPHRPACILSLVIEYGPNVLFCMPNSTDCILLVSAMALRGPPRKCDPGQVQTLNPKPRCSPASPGRAE
jgi:hypothetical protein